LLEVQGFDICADEARERIEMIRSSMASLEDGLKILKEKIESVKKDIASSNVLKKEKELAISALEGQIKKHNLELNTVKANEAYKALMLEIKNARDQKTQTEDEILVLMEKDENSAAEIKRLLGECARAEQEVAAKKSEVEEEIKKTEAVLNDCLEKKKVKAQELPAYVAAQYESIRKNRGGTVVVEIESSICGGCHRVLTLQTVDEVMKGNNIVVCDHCQRILYRKP
jgi:hypothetical protein